MTRAAAAASACRYVPRSRQAELRAPARRAGLGVGWRARCRSATRPRADSRCGQAARRTQRSAGRWSGALGRARMQGKGAAPPRLRPPRKGPQSGRRARRAPRRPARSARRQRRWRRPRCQTRPRPRRPARRAARLPRRRRRPRPARALPACRRLSDRPGCARSPPHRCRPPRRATRPQQPGCPAAAARGGARAQPRGASPGIRLPLRADYGQA